MKANPWNLVAGGAAVAATVAARKGLASGWKKATGTRPPDNPADPTTGWRQALAWGALTGAVVGVARIVANRQSARLHQRATGSLPDEVAADAE